MSVHTGAADILHAHVAGAAVLQIEELRRISLIEANYFENVKNPVTSRDSSRIGYWELRNNYVGSGITWDTPSGAVNATNWGSTQSYGPTGYSYTPIAGIDVKFDGSGYPQGLKGHDIHEYARIVAVADVFDALMHKRCYKDAWPVEQVVAHMREVAGKHLDPKFVELLIANMDKALAINERFPD